MDAFYGDPMLFKVEKSVDADNSGLSSYKVIATCNQIPLIDMFFDICIPDMDIYVSFSVIFYLIFLESLSYSYNWFSIF
jgi:hypothetical protein